MGTKIDPWKRCLDEECGCLKLAGSLFFSTSVGFFRSQPNAAGKYIIANPALMHMFGYEKMDEFLSISVADTYWDRPDCDRLSAELVSSGQVKREEVRLRKRDGGMFWGAVTAGGVKDDSGEVVYFDGTIEDISLNKEYELKLIEEKRFSESVIAALPGCFWLHDETGRCLRWNKHVETVYGYSPEELRRLDVLRDMVTPETYPGLLEAANNAFNGRPAYCEYEIVTKSGEKIAYAGQAKLVVINGKKYLSSIEIDITKRKNAEDKLREALSEIKKLKEQVEAENIYLMAEIEREADLEHIVGQGKALREVLLQVRKVAPTNITVLIQGETGTGKGILAHLVHNLSPRKSRPLIKVNCAALPANLIESELFGHEKGAFTGADSRKAGRFELANGSTIFLDEIAELPLELQAKLLRVLEDGEFERLGGTKTISVDARIVAATNRNLDEEVRAGGFRQDLLYRLKIYPITSPALRERKEDIPLLVKHFITKANKETGRSVMKVPREVMTALEEYEWPGNIRELRNTIARAVINSSGACLDIVGLREIVSGPKKNEPIGKTMQEMERSHIVNVLNETNWVIEGDRGASRVLGVNASTLRHRMKRLGISRQTITTQL
jgi:formate hydrogenlyase transcriptional activator